MQRQLRFESLEKRTVLSAVPTAELIDGTLNIIGTDAPVYESVHLSMQTDSSGQPYIRVGGVEDGAKTFDPALVEKIYVEMGDGDDRLDIVSAGPTFNVEIEIVDGDGEDRVLGRDFELNGDVLYRKTGTGSGFATFDRSVLRDVTYLVENDQLGARINTGFGGQTIVNGDVVVSGGTGQTFFQMKDAELHGDFDISSVGGQVWTIFTRSDVFGKVDIQGNSSNLIPDKVQIEESRFHKKLDIELDDGQDFLLISGNSTFEKQVNVDFGDGDDVLRTFNSGTGGNILFQHHLRVWFGLGADVLQEFDPTVSIVVLKKLTADELL